MPRYLAERRWHIITAVTGACLQAFDYLLAGSGLQNLLDSLQGNSSRMHL